MTWQERVEQVSVGLHLVHGTRGLAIGGLVLLVLGILEPILPAQANSTPVVFLAFALFIIGAATLPREGVAVQQRARSLVRHDDAAKRLARTLVWPILLAILLAPRAFLAAYGIPHLNPLTGVIYHGFQRGLAHGLLFTVLLVAVVYLRSTRNYAKHILAKRPVHLSTDDRAHQERDGLLWMGVFITLAFGFLLRSFWAPFSLVAWPPSLDSFARGARGVASVGFGIVVPLLLFNVAAGHLALLRRLILAPDRTLHWPTIVMATLHVALAFLCVGLHGYDLLWIAQYRVSSPF